LAKSNKEVTQPLLFQQFAQPFDFNSCFITFLPSFFFPGGKPIHFRLELRNRRVLGGSFSLSRFSNSSVNST